MKVDNQKYRMNTFKKLETASKRELNELMKIRKVPAM